MKRMQVCGTEIEVKGRLLRIAALAADGFHYVTNPEAMIQQLRSSAVQADLFTFLQKLPNTTPNYPYPMEWDNFAALPISTFEHWWTKELGFKGRNKAKQAEKKGVVIKEVPFDETLVKGIWEIYNEAPVRQGRRFPHYGKNLETIRKDHATFLESSIFIGAFFEGRLIGFIKLVHDLEQSQAATMNILSMIAHRDKAPTNALVAQAVRSCADRGFSHLIYSNFTYGKKKPDSIAEFKERNAFQRVEIPRYYVPLTARGSVALRLGLHHRLAERVPEPVAAKLRSLRNAWYSRRLQSAT